MLTSMLDHLVIVAATLEQGEQYCADLLGVRPSGGGAHQHVGTHNRLLSLGPGLYLEVIAINPDAGPATVARWFGMDDPAVRQRIAASPALLTFVARTNDIAAAQRALPELGPYREMSRGNLHWQITMAPDGKLREDGCLPPVIQWPESVHPSANLPDFNCRLVSLDVHHPDPVQLKQKWHQMGLSVDDRLQLHAAGPREPAHLIARISTPDGLKEIR